MILPYIKKVLIVPDFGTCADDVEMLSLKEFIEAPGTARVMITDLRKMVIEEHQDDNIRDCDVIEFAARKLEAIAEDRNLTWGQMLDNGFEDPLLDAMDFSEQYANNEQIFGSGLLPIHITQSANLLEIGAPDSIVVFGRSAMLADGVSGIDVLFVNPEYDNEWPWKKQYYAGRKVAEHYYMKNFIRQKNIETAYSFGAVISGRFSQPNRYAIFTSDEKAGKGESFSDRYPYLSMIDTSLSDNPAALSKLICNFAEGKMDIPLLKIDEMLADFPCEKLLPERCRFSEPIEIKGLSVVGLKFGTPIGPGQSGIKVCVKEKDYPLPIETFNHYKELSALRDAVTAAREKAKTVEKTIKRIMIVPDYFSPHDNPAVLELRKKLRKKGCHVTVFCAGNTLEDSRRGLERICKRRRYDMIVTLSTGCLLAARISASDRIYINPDWAAWEWMRHMLGEDEVRVENRDDHGCPFSSYRIDKNEIAMARDMGARYNVRQHRSDKLSAGWFTSDEMDSHLPDEHQQRFGSATYPPHIGLDTESGIAALAKEIDKTIKTVMD